VALDQSLLGHCRVSSPKDRLFRIQTSRLTTAATATATPQSKALFSTNSHCIYYAQPHSHETGRFKSLHPNARRDRQQRSFSRISSIAPRKEQNSTKYKSIPPVSVPVSHSTWLTVARQTQRYTKTKTWDAWANALSAFLHSVSFPFCVACHRCGKWFIHATVGCYSMPRPT
jgi:hypothetical protein